MLSLSLSLPLSLSPYLPLSFLGSWEFGPFVPLPSSASMLDAMFLLSARRRLHRIPVVDPEGDIMNIITQSALLRVVVREDRSRKV